MPKPKNQNLEPHKVIVTNSEGNVVWEAKFSLPRLDETQVTKSVMTNFLRSKLLGLVVGAFYR